MARLRFLGALLVMLAGFGMPAQADQPGMERLYNALRLSQSLAILRAESLSYALNNDKALLGKPGTAAWARAMQGVHDTAALEKIVQQNFYDALRDVDVSPLVRFFESEAGQRVVDLEITARDAFRNRDIEEAARAAWRANPDSGRHADAIQAFIQVGDLIERNVTGSLNANYRFLRALMQASPGTAQKSEAQILSDVWAQAPAIRADAEEWLYAFLSVAYAPLSSADMAAYLAVWQTPQGRALNNAMFLGFDQMFEVISDGIGTAAANLRTSKQL